MGKHWTKLAGLALALALAAVAAAQDEPAGRAEGRRVREGRAEEEAARAPAEEGDMAERPDREPPERSERDEARRLGTAMALRILNAAADTPEGRKALDAFQEKAEAFQEEIRDAMRTRREKMQQARQEGADPEAIRNLAEESQAEVAKRQKAFFAEQIAVLKELVAIAEKHQEELAEGMPARFRGGRRAGQDRPDAPPADEEGDAPAETREEREAQREARRAERRGERQEQ